MGISKRSMLTMVRGQNLEAKTYPQVIRCLGLEKAVKEVMQGSIQIKNKPDHNLLYSKEEPSVVGIFTKSFKIFDVTGKCVKSLPFNPNFAIKEHGEPSVNTFVRSRIVFSEIKGSFSEKFSKNIAISTGTEYNLQSAFNRHLHAQKFKWAYELVVYGKVRVPIQGKDGCVIKEYKLGKQMPSYLQDSQALAKVALASPKTVDKDLNFFKEMYDHALEYDVDSGMENIKEVLSIGS